MMLEHIIQVFKTAKNYVSPEPLLNKPEGPHSKNLIISPAILPTIILIFEMHL